MDLSKAKAQWINPVVICFFKFTMFALLTIITQIGGLTYIVSLIATRVCKLRRFWYGSLLHLLIYLIAIFAIVPNIAAIFGREPIAISDNLQPTNYFLTVGLNRNYVVPELNKVLVEISAELSERLPGATLYFLDANFPFLNNFPLLPHLSHNDGRKVDFSFIYENLDGTVSSQRPSVSGYGVFETSMHGEQDTTKMCKDQGFYQYDYPKYLTLGNTSEQLEFSEKWNKILLEIIISNPKIEKVFIEPHLATRLALKHTKIRFQGCRSVRHDDHIHIQI